MQLLILDLDETLVFARETKLPHAEDFRVGEFFVYKRPGLDRFIECIFQHFKVAVWTASNANYADAVIKQVFVEPQRLEFAWSRQRCTWGDIESCKLEEYPRWIKRLRRYVQWKAKLEDDNSYSELSVGVPTGRIGNRECAT